MIFSTPEFLFIFLPTVWLIFWLLSFSGKQHLLLGWLGLASFVFYSVWDITLLPLLLGSIAVNYWLAGYVTSPNRAWLWLGVGFNLGLLGWFKYSIFFLSLADLPPQSFSPLVLPLGISFFTFQQIAFLVDVRQGAVQRGRLSLYGVFVSFFPQLIAGPIVHYRELAPQLAILQRPSASAVRCGLLLLALGLAKKLLIADNLAPYVDRLYNAPADSIVAGDTLMAGWSYGLQLYFDFSGYADMAIGLALLFGITLPNNFASPYRAANIQLFWQRWHITLSQFLRDYLYIPLGGSRHGLPRHLLALMVTMLLGGLWHGAGWQFLVWGGLHGALLTMMVVWRRLSVFRFPFAASWAFTFVAVMLAWVPFRATGLEQTWSLYSGLAVWQWGALGDLANALNQGVMSLRSPELLILVATLIVLIMPNSMHWAKRLTQPHHCFWQGAVVGGLLLVVFKAMIDLPSQAFLYFNF
ncbi:alginate O-acetylation protein [Vreelandella venusta]|uniref:Probable alginate O-acetylase n=1 Tax=Halomonas hydrothermalis TaxID=115561 RepID=A0A6F8U4U9_9GAMM|nr:MBOAT family protein [Halomonas hydrothermalis]BCB08588.1 alginate O-acetylation protein [Halomonas hydrothermalis]